MMTFTCISVYPLSLFSLAVIASSRIKGDHFHSAVYPRSIFLGAGMSYTLPIVFKPSRKVCTEKYEILHSVVANIVTSLFLSLSLSLSSSLSLSLSFSLSLSLSLLIYPFLFSSLPSQIHTCTHTNTHTNTHISPIPPKEPYQQSVELETSQGALSVPLKAILPRAQISAPKAVKFGVCSVKKSIVVEFQITNSR